MASINGIHLAGENQEVKMASANRRHHLCAGGYVLGVAYLLARHRRIMRKEERMAGIIAGGFLSAKN